MAINLDERIQNRKNFIIGGQEVSIPMNDEFAKHVAEVNMEILDVQDQISALKPEEADEMSLDEQKKYVFEKFDKISSKARQFFDDVIGEGEGDRIYKYYNSDTQALALIINQLNEESTNILKQNRQQRRQKYTNNKRR